MISGWILQHFDVRTISVAWKLKELSNIFWQKIFSYDDTMLSKGVAPLCNGKYSTQKKCLLHDFKSPHHIHRHHLSLLYFPFLILSSIGYMSDYHHFIIAITDTGYEVSQKYFAWKMRYNIAAVLLSRSQ